MTNFINNLRTLFEFLFEILGDVADFFTTNTLGIIVLGFTIFVLVLEVVSIFLDKFRK